LALHPHLNCHVTAGGIFGGQWEAVSKDYLLPFEVVRRKFRGKFLAGMRKALEKGELVLPDGMRPQQLENLLNKLGRKKWHVHLKESYSHGRGVLIYLSGYLRGCPISNKRISKIRDGKVRFDYGRERREYMSLPVEQFIGRYLQHVPLPNSVQVRSYGIYHHSCRAQLELWRKLLGQAPVQEKGFLDWQSLWVDRGEPCPDRCAVCGRRLVRLEVLRGKKDARQILIVPSEHLSYDRAL